MKCCECGKIKKLFQLKPIIKHVDGMVDYICRKCWIKYDYNAFMHEKW